MVENDFFKPSEVKAITSYLITNFILGSVIMIIMAFFISLFSANYSVISLIDLVSKTPDLVNEADLSMYYNINTYTNLICYLFSFLFVCLYMRHHLISDYNVAKQKPLIYILVGIGSAIIFYGVSLLVSIFIDSMVGVSENQSLIEGMILNGGAIPVFFAVVIFAPIVEELIYRKAIFHFFKNKHIIVSYIVSSVIFALPHMISTPIENITDWLLMCIPYLVSAILLCLIYHLSKKNIYVVWIVHMINNLVSFILILL